MQSAFKKILCPIDINLDCSEALELSLMLAQQHQASIRLLYVSSIPLHDPSEAAAAPAAEAWSRLQELGREWLGGRVPYDVEIWTRVPAPAILRAINDSEADLVVMATHGRKGMDRLVLGSVAEQVVRDSSKPVLTIKPTQSRKGLH